MAGDARPIIVAMRAYGHGWDRIANLFNEAKLPTPSGTGQWYGASVKHHLHASDWAAAQRLRRALGR